MARGPGLEVVPEPEPSGAAVPVRGGRIAELDAVRGMALLGISIVNTVGITGMATTVEGDRSRAAYWAYETLLHQRFFPIFSFLFGLSFGIFLHAAREKIAHPRVIMLARLGFLICFGALHRLLQPDEVLFTYGVVGIVVLLPASFMPGWAVLVLGGMGTAAGVMVGGGIALIPGVFLLGLSAERLGIRNMLAAATGRLAVSFVVCSTLALALNIWQIRAAGPSMSALAALAGLVTAASYTIGLVLILRSRLHWVTGGLVNVGRMALTSYVGATVLIIVANRFVKLDEAPNYGTAILVGGFIFLLEMVVSSVWLRYARYGPLEWLWRCLTWWRIVPIRSRAA